MMNEQEKSDPSTVAMKPANRSRQMDWELVERREGAKGNAIESPTCRTQSRESVPSGLDRVRQRAKQEKKERFTALMHHVNIDSLRSAFRRLKRDAASGVDGVTWQQYERSLEANLVDLHQRIHRGTYRPLPSRRVYIAKSDGRRRPLGIAALEDKIVQRAVLEVLNVVYEEDFLGFSYGFRPKRSQHDALDALSTAIIRTKVGYILDCDIEAFFDSVCHTWLLRFIEHRVSDPRMLRLIRQWLKAGVLEDGNWSANELGTPQGSGISPLLGNIFLHYAFDLWAKRWRHRSARGNVIMVRYCDDIVVGFERRVDAECFMTELQERLAKFALTLHPKKTRLIEFGRFAARDRARRGLGKPETFNFLGFTHICGQSRAGTFHLKRYTQRDRMRRRLAAIKVELRRRMHDPIPDQGKWLGQVVRGYLAYHAIPTNYRRVRTFSDRVLTLWHRTLRRRSQKDVTTQERMRRLGAAFLPPTRILHPWPMSRFGVKHPRWKPNARIGPVRFCAGGAQ